MLIIRFKLLWIVVALIGAYLVVNQASAQTFGPSNYIRFINVGNPTEGFISCPSAFEPYTSECNFILSNFNAPGFVINVSGGSNAGQYTVVSTEFNPDRYTFTVTPAPLVTVTDFSESVSLIRDIPPPNNPTWGNDGIWGSANTTETVKEELVASVQATGANLWPMLIFLGVVLAFAIFGYLLTSLDKSVKPKNARRASKRFDPVQFNRKADELMEFYSKTGGTDPELVKQIKKNIK